MNDVERCISEWVDRVNERDATIAALQAQQEKLFQYQCPKAQPSCLMCGQVEEFAIKHLELGAIGICVTCVKQQSQLTQRTAERDALKLVNDTHMKTVMKLSHIVEQRTAELEALKIHCAIVEEHKVIAYKDAANLQAELERVRGELVEATHNANVYHSLYSTGCMDRALLENELRDLRTLIAALPKVEGEIVAQAGYVKDRKKVYACFGSDADMTAYAALLRERQKLC